MPTNPLEQLLPQPQPERRVSQVDLMMAIDRVHDALGVVGEKVDANTEVTAGLAERVGAIESTTSEWRGGLNFGKWFLGTALALGLIVMGFLGLPISR